MLFGRRESSEILESMSLVDPMRIRNEAIDDFFVFYENSNEAIDIFSKDLSEYKTLLTRLEDINLSESSTHAVKESVLKLFIRLCWLTKNRQDLLKDDQDYVEYMSALYLWNNGDYKKLKDIYSVVERGVLAWNGPSGKNEMRIAISDKKTGYHLVQEIQIKAKPDNTLVERKEKLVSFRDELKLKYSYGEKEEAELDVDFALYALLKKVICGYIPSVNDKRVNVKCEEFIKKIARGGKKMETLIIRDLSHRDSAEYILNYDATFGYSFEVK